MGLPRFPRSLAATLTVSGLLAASLSSLGGTWEAPPGAPPMATPRGTAPLPPGVTPVASGPSRPGSGPVIGAAATPVAAPVGVAPAAATPAPALPPVAPPAAPAPSLSPVSAPPAPAAPAPTATPAPRLPESPAPIATAAAPAAAVDAAPPGAAAAPAPAFPALQPPSVQVALLPGQGGVLTSGDGRVTVTVPPVEVAAPAVLNYSAQPAPDEARQAAVRQGLLLTNVEFALSVAPGAAPRAEIVAAYSPAQVSGIAEDSLRLYQRRPSDGAWDALSDCAPGATAGRLRCTAPAQGQFLLAGARPPSPALGLAPAGAGAGVPWTALGGGAVAVVGVGGAAWWLTGRKRL